MEGARTPLYLYEVDMTLDSGKGDLKGPYNGSGEPIGLELNFSGIYPPNNAYENLSAIGHANGKDYWLVNRTRGHFFVWLVTEDGINSTPDYSFPIGVDPGVADYPTLPVSYGHIKFSPDGTVIANTTGHNPSSITLASFDKATGTITGIINHNFSNDQVYGLSFSPNGKYVYYTFTYTGPLMRMSVDDLLNGVPQSELTINTGAIVNIQLGPDNRIYGIASNARSLANYRNLYVILNPDDENLNLAIIPDFFPEGTGSHLSMPTFTSSFFNIGDIESDPLLPVCMGKEILFSVQIGIGSGENRVTKIEWDFGDGLPIVVETDMDQYTFVQKYTYTKPGKYSLTLIPYKSDGSVLTDKIKTLEVKISSCIMPVNHNISVMEY